MHENYVYISDKITEGGPMSLDVVTINSIMLLQLILHAKLLMILMTVTLKHDFCT